MNRQHATTTVTLEPDPSPWEHTRPTTTPTEMPRCGALVPVVSSKGGVGRSSIAAGAATAAAHAGLGRVLLIDLDLEGGDAAALVGVDGERTIVDVAMSQGDLDSGKLEGFASRTKRGLHVLAAPSSRSDVSLVTPERVRQILGIARQTYDLVVVDTPARLDEASVVALEFATTLLLVTTPEVTAARRTRRDLDVLAASGHDPARIEVVANRSSSHVGVGLGDVEHALGRSIGLRVPSSRTVPSSANSGRAIVDSHPRCGVARAYGSIAHRITPERKRQRRSWLRRMAVRASGDELSGSPARA